VWSKEYRFQLENVEGNGNIPARYQDKYQNSSSDLVLVFCDTDKKKKNAPKIFELTGIEGYKGRADQRQELFSRITKENYQEMRERIKKLPSDDIIEGSTNFDRFIEYFTTDDSKWIQVINKSLEE